MKVVVLLSAGRHPVSGLGALPRLEAQAIRLGAALGPMRGLHAGPDAEAVAEALGRGLSEIDHVALGAGADPVPALAAALRAAAPDVVLAGRRGQGGDETGLVPYALARALGATLIPDVIAARPGSEPGVIEVEQALPKGAARRLVVRSPVVLTVHSAAPEPRPYAFGQVRRGRIEPLAVSAPEEPAAVAIAEKPYRARPKMMRGAPAGGSAADRLKAATGGGEAVQADVMVSPEPREAARAILAYLRQVGVLPPPARAG
ncbi:electron transfer flavoprotein beta subunit [Methylopila capsulata]|uniref:Electron transfer flavoprotein beta subunit n=1 Tax=Methylopila capsulata TaxID=61654 RepID=A0A9W6IY22_9HYPH|nr:electron transfer flavoprotein subunit beta [Methylopila capsulata]MBM7853530.1 electron transfer flavoprotein beta subunit [Methylopila capsulata]GLK57255.1 electron transfer flavoprotein subunit beta [Methylopila capsulata]